MEMTGLSTMQKSKSQSGFTLIEIAIVLVIIGLLLGGVLQGQQLIENSRVRSATNDLNGIAAAMFSYQDRYGRLPGDDGPQATLAARGGNWTVIDTAAEAGNTDGILTTAADGSDTFTGGNEIGPFFQHLRAAGFIAGNAADTGATALPQNPFGGLIGMTSSGTVHGLNGTKVCMSNVGGSAAIALDTQLDDGDPDTGRFRANAGTGNAAPTAATVGGTYAEDTTYTVCYRL